MNDEQSTVSETEKPQDPTKILTHIPLGTMGYTLLVALISGVIIILFITSAIAFIARENWADNVIIWPSTLYIGAILGGLIGGIVVCWEIWMSYSTNRPISNPKLLSSDLFYITMLIILTYVLEFLSESLILQGIFFMLEFAIFIVIGRNISKYMMERSNDQGKAIEHTSECEDNQS